MERKKIPPKAPMAKLKRQVVFDPKSFLKNFLEFSEKINDDYLCAICYNLLYQPTTLPCNHKFCYPCLERWFNHEQSSFSCPMCQRSYPLTTDFHVNKEMEERLSQQYEKEYKLLTQFKKWEHENRKFNEIKCFYGNSYSEDQTKRKWSFFFRLKQGLINNYIDKINIKINANSQGLGGQNVDLTKYPFIYTYNINNGQSVFSLLVHVHWKKNFNVNPTRINYDVVLNPEGRLLSYLFKEKLEKGKRGNRNMRNQSR